MYKVLDLTLHGKQDLESADFLAEYDAICLDPSWPLFRIEPGREITWPQVDAQIHNYRVMEALLARRSSEIWPFFVHGGVLVARVVEPAKVRIGGLTDFIDSYTWWYSTAVRAADGAIPPDWSTYVRSGSGEVHVLEPGHPFETYLRATRSYEARLTHRDRVITLAENRTGEPVAAEVACLSGALIFIPPPLDEGGEYLLRAAIDDALQSRIGIAQNWIVAEERTLTKERDAVLGEMREKRREIDRRLTRTRELKDGVLRTLHVERAIGYYRAATRAVPTPKKAIPPLWNLIEMLREHYNKGTSGLATILGLPKEDLEFLDTLANKRELDLRHTTSGELQPVLESELRRALDIGKRLVEGAIQYEFGKAVALPAAAGRPNGYTR